jgi:hypothetical protein
MRSCVTRQFHVLIRRQGIGPDSRIRKRDSARTVEFEKWDSTRTVGFGNQTASAQEIPEEPGNERTKERFDFERERLGVGSETASPKIKARKESYI